MIPVSALILAQLVGKIEHYDVVFNMVGCVFGAGVFEEYFVIGSPVQGDIGVSKEKLDVYGDVGGVAILEDEENRLAFI
jgi:hypothetical protein